MSGLLKNKNVLVMGVRNKWSIAWGIVNVAKENGANIILTYQGEREKTNAEEFAKSIGDVDVYQCDITSDEDIESLFEKIRIKTPVIHGVVHSIAHAKSEDLQNSFIDTSRDGFAHAMNVSAYSLVAVSRKAKELMSEGGSVITLTYMGSEKVFPGYNVMGVAKSALECSVKYLAYDLGTSNIRINAISAGPIKTLSAKGISGFGSIIEVVEKKAPLRRGVEQEDLGDAALFLLSDLSRAITGEVMHVDCGYNIMGI